MPGSKFIPQIVSDSEAKARFGELVKWVSKDHNKVIVKHHGESAVVMISYGEYEEVQKLYQREQKRQALAELEMLRQEARRQYPNLSADEAYRQTGLSEEIIQATRQADQALNNA